MNAQPIKIKIEKNPQGEAVLLEGNLDIYTSIQLKNRMGNIVFEKNKLIVLDMANIRYIDSSGIGLLIRVFTQASEKNARCYITGLKPIISKIFKVAGLNGYFKILPWEEYKSKFPGIEFEGEIE